MSWSPSSGTALADAELEYDEKHISHAAYVKFLITQRSAALKSLTTTQPIYALIWTTTPWTLPANKAILVHPELQYSVTEHNGDNIIVASDRLPDIGRVLGIPDGGLRTILSGIKGADLVDGLTYLNGFQGVHAIAQPVLTARFVSPETGTGLVHAAPGHGHDEYNLCTECNIEAFAPVDNLGRFTREAMPDTPEKLEGLPVLRDGNKAVLEWMESPYTLNGSPKLAFTHKHVHKYPIDWRTKSPVIIRATPQWFADVDDIKHAALHALENVRFIPVSAESRLRQFVQNRSQWCISRQRAWGVPIPVLYKGAGESAEAVLSSESISHIIGMIAQRGSDSWWTDDEDDTRWIAPSLPHGEYIRGKDTMDVWFDSGTTWTQLAAKRNTNDVVADVYLEGSDQHRGWFQSSLLTRIASLTKPNSKVSPQAPYRRLITHGFVLDEKGRKMSKSIGNVVSPEQIMDGTLLPPLKLRKGGKISVQQPDQLQYDAMGPDALRLWVASNDYTHDVPIGQQVLQGINIALHKYRVTLKWLLGVLHEYNESAASTARSLPSNLGLSNRLALRHLAKVEQSVHAAYSAYKPYTAMRELQHYVNIGLSSFFFETAKDVIYTSTQEDRSRALYVCNEILQSLLVMLAPATPLLVAEALHYASSGLQTLFQTQDKLPFRRIWRLRPLYDDTGDLGLRLEDQDRYVHSIRHIVNNLQEQLRKTKAIGSGLATTVYLTPLHHSANVQSAEFVRKITESGELARALVVSNVELLPYQDERAASLHGETVRLDDAIEYAIKVSRASGAKCPRCWRYAISPSEIKEVEFNEGRQVCRRCTSALKDL